MHVVNLLQTKLGYMFCSRFELFIVSGASTNHGLPSLMPIFAGNAFFHSSCISIIFVWSHKAIFFLKNKVILSSILVKANGPSNNFLPYVLQL